AVGGRVAAVAASGGGGGEGGGGGGGGGAGGLIVPPPWQAWDLHPSVVIGLVLMGGLYVSWGGLAAPRRQVAAFMGALVVLFFALNGPLHNLSDHYLFSAHMAQHLVLTLLFP